MGLSKSVPFSEFEPLKSYGYFCQILAFFTMPALQIWSCHVTQDANFENFLFCPKSTFNIRKSHKISGGKLSTSEGISQKNLTGVENTPPPVSLGLILTQKWHNVTS